ncbi:MAG: biotin--[acetyl-CoA-carboxylase] ligase [Duodenibacillus sp.]|nr:biotin--[acetyl-CoA-carboxylase] ligase [Duodenibacillus sp.]
MEALDRAQLLRERIVERPGDWAVAWTPCCESTMLLARELAASDLSAEAAAAVSDRQTAGRGTHGRRWSNPSSGLMLTLALRLDKPAAAYGGVTLALGAAVAEACAGHCPDVRLKWPNDIWRPGGKAGGILTETFRMRGAVWLSAGIGLNLAGAPPADGSYATASLLELHLPETERVALAARIIRKAAAAVRGFGPEALAALAGRWPALDAFYGRPVTWHDEAGALLAAGVDLGIDERGRLKLGGAGGVALVQSGSIRPSRHPAEQTP